MICNEFIKNSCKVSNHDALNTYPLANGDCLKRFEQINIKD